MFNKKMKELFEGFYAEIRSKINAIKDSLSDYLRKDEINEMTSTEMDTLLQVTDKEIASAKLDRASLTALITTANEKLDDTTVNYTEASKTNLQTAITTAQAVSDSIDSTQDDIDAQVVALQAAIDALVCKSVLEALIATANEKLTQTDVTYTEGTLAALQTAVSNAQAVVNNTDATQTEVDAQVTALQSAINGLIEVVPQEPEIPYPE